MKDVQILLPGAMTPLVVEGVSSAFTVHQLQKGADREAFLRKHGREVRGIASTGSHGPIGEALFDQLPKLEIVSHFGVGYDNVDVVEAGRRGIVVTNTPGVLTDEVADLTLGLLIATVRELPRAEQHVRTGEWRKGAYPLTATLRNRSVGILGLGRIGKAIATRCEAFGLTVAYHGRNRQVGASYEYFGSPHELAKAVDVLIAVTPGGSETRHLVDARVLEALGPNGIFINVARGSVVDEDALIAALRSKTILAAGLDVFENEPNIRPEFLELDNAVLLPHVASASVHTRNAMGQLVVDNLLSWFSGKGAVSPVPELENMARQGH
jgi:lactate dehydrogenase-like 2-hydroxyacid dehydrogenase